MSSTPQVKALLLCTSIHRRTSPDRLSLDGLFTVICGREFPLVLSRLFLFFRLTDALGEWDATFRLVHQESQEALASGGTSLRSENPFQIIDFVVEAGEVMLPWEGRYCVELFLDGRFSHQTVFDAVKLDADAIDAGGIGATTSDDVPAVDNGSTTDVRSK